VLAVAERGPALVVAVCRAVAVGVVDFPNAAVPRADQVVAVEAEPVRAGLGAVGKERGGLGDAVTVGVDEPLDVARTGHDDLAAGVDRQRIDVRRQVVAGVQRDFKLRRGAQA
jgi:hypothetical protein